MRRLHPSLLVSLVALSACASDITAPDLLVDPALSFEAAHARWLSVRPPDYSFEFEAQNGASPSQGYYRVTVIGGRLAAVQRSYSGELAPIQEGFTIDELWGRLSTAREAGESISELQFSQEGVPIQAAVGAAGNDRAVRYHLRWYTPGRTPIF